MLCYTYIYTTNYCISQVIFTIFYCIYFMFWNNVKLLLKENKITQKQFSIQLELPERTIETWICRNTIPDAITSVKIAKTLNTTVEFLVTGIESKLPNDVQKTVTKLLTLTEKQREPINVLIDGQVNYWKNIKL